MKTLTGIFENDGKWYVRFDDDTQGYFYGPYTSKDEAQATLINRYH